MGEVLLSRTSKDVHRVEVEAAILCPAQPAPLVITLSACHVIAPRDLLKTNLTLRTVAHITHVCSPILKLLVHCILALHIAMPLLPTVKAYLKTTLTPYSPVLTLREVMVAVRSWTPFKVRVNVYIYILFELKILVIYFLRTKLPYFIPCELILTLILRALYLSHLPILNIVL
jgi:hypothetical protein